ncbi:MAG: type IV pilus assembly protein PilM [Dehalococcoidia bacterium]
MASKIPVWGIDVGQCSLKAVKVQAAGDHAEVLAADIVEHDSILSNVESDAPENIRKAIETFLSRNDIKDCQVVVSVPGQQTLTRFSKMPPVETKKIPDMVQYEASQQIPFDMDEVVWDYQVFAEKDSPDVEVGIFAIRKELIRNHLSHFMTQGIEPMIVQTSPMASYNAVAFEWPPQEGQATILLDMGALATDLIVSDGNRIWSRPVPIGGNRFTEALVSAFKISFKKAERLKRSAASSKYARQVFQAMRPVFADLVSEVQRSIGFYTSIHREAHIHRVLGMGNAFKLPGLQKFLQQNLQIKVEKITGFKKLTWGAGDKPAKYAENVMSFGVAYGLALQGLDLAAVKVNLLPLEVRRTLLWRKKRVWFAASAACLALAAGSLWGGNVMAGSKLASGVGTLRGTSLKLPPAASVDQAERIVNGGATGAPVEYAAKLAAAAEKLKQEASLASGSGVGDQALLKDMAKLPANNVLVPRIIEVVHRAFSEASREDLAAVGSAREYQELARRAPREDRCELWIRQLDMRYDSKDAAKPFALNKEAKPSGPAKPGWAVSIIGRTTAANPAKVIDERLVNALDRIGREPQRGIYFVKATLAKVEPVSESGGGKLSTPFKNQGRQRDSGRSTRGTGRGGGRRGARDGGGTRRGGGGGSTRRGAGADRSTGTRQVGRLPRASQGSSGPSSGQAGLGKWRERYRGHDPLTDEKCTGDHEFEILAVVHQGNTPKKLIPEEYQEKKDQDQDQEQKSGEADG